MNIDPKKIARMISEDPNEVAPSDHFDDTEDEYRSNNPPDQEFDIIINFEVLELDVVAGGGHPDEFQDPEDIQRKIIDDIEGLFRDAWDYRQYHARLTNIQSDDSRIVGRNSLPRLRVADHEY